MKQCASYILFLFISSFMMSCTVLTSSSSSSSPSNSYEEDLSVYRIDYSQTETQTLDDTLLTSVPNVEFTSAENISVELNMLLDSIGSMNRKKGYIDGYSVQVFSGSRESAANAKDRVYRIMPDSRPKIEYNMPNFVVQVGEYRNRLEAHEAFAKLKDAFPTTIIIPKRIYF